jgi:hypothetical protein
MRTGSPNQSVIIYKMRVVFRTYPLLVLPAVGKKLLARLDS